MALDTRTYGDLKAAVVQGMSRPDLSDYCILELEAVIRDLQKEYLYASPTTVTTEEDGLTQLVTVAGQRFYPMPSNLIAITTMRLLQAGSNWQPLNKYTYDWMLAVDTIEPPPRSIPNAWAPYDNQFRLYQVADQAYPLELTGPGKVPVPVADTEISFWTTACFDLVRYATMAQVYLIKIKDDKSFQRCASAAEKYRQGLVTETVQKVSNGQFAAHL